MLIPQIKCRVPMAISAYMDGLKLDPEDKMLKDGLEELQVCMHLHNVLNLFI